MASCRGVGDARSSTSGSTGLLVNFILQTTLLSVLQLSAAVASGGVPRDQQDYCHADTFFAECKADDEVLVVRSALYGRMRGNSRCVQADPNSYVGCRADVTKYADRLCSGRKACRIQVPNQSFEAVKPCPKAYRSYLEIAVECQKVTTVPDSVQCGPDWPVTVPASTTEVRQISSFVAVQRGLGSPNCPWRIEAEPGRRINLTLIDFATPTAPDTPATGAPASSPGNEHQQSSPSGTVLLYSGGPLSRTCLQYAAVNERSGLVGSTTTGRSLPICGGDRRERHIIVSASNVVDLQVSRRNVDTDREFFFLLQYRAVGCTEPQAPRFGWLIRERGGQSVTVGCNATGRSWRLTCNETRWIGDFKFGTDKCPRALVRKDRVAMTWSSLNLPSKVTLGVLIGLAATAFIILLLFVLICAEWIKVRRPTRSRSKSHLLLERHDDNRSAAGGATNRQPQQPASNSTSCGGGGGGNRQANSTTTTTTTTTADIGRNQMGHDRERNAANQKMIGGGATGSNHVLVDLDASSPMDTPPPSPPLPPLPPQSGGRDDTPTSATAAGGGDDMSTYVREMWPMAPPPVPMMMGGGNSMITSFPLPPPPLLPPESTMSPELSDSSTQHRKKRTLSTGAGVVGRQPIQTTTVTLVNTGPALPPRPASAYVGGTMQASSGEYVSLASNTNGTQTWNPRAMNVRPIAVPASAGGGSASHHSNVVGGSRTGGGCTSKAYDNDYDSTHIHETPLYVRREQMANATSTAMAGSAATMSAAGGSIHGRRSIGGGMSMGKNSDRQNKHQQQQQRYFEMIPNGCDSTDYDNEDDDDDDDDNDDDLRGGYDSIAAVTARCRSKSLPRNVAVLSSSAASSANAAAYGANRYH